MEKPQFAALNLPASPVRPHQRTKRTSTATPSTYMSSSPTASGRRTSQSSSPRVSVTRARSGSTSSESGSECSQDYGGNQKDWRKSLSNPLAGRDSDSEGSSDSSTGSRLKSRSAELTRLAPLIPRMLRESIEISETPQPGRASTYEKPGSKQSALPYRRTPSSDRKVSTSPHRIPGAPGSSIQEQTTEE